VLLGIHNVSEHSPEIRHKPSMFCAMADNGGMLSADRTKLYYFSIIDILTEYNTKKKIEHATKAFILSKDISCVPPKPYADRFIKFMEQIIE
jgi:1-phosphatidylinositol-4-phosphate 5-kinase